MSDKAIGDKAMKRVLITGASSGIGHQLAIDYAQQHWQVIACGTNTARLNDLKALNPNITTLTFDVTNQQSTSLALDSLTDVPSLIIFNAGSCEYIDNGKIDSALFKRVFDVNVMGIVHCLESLQPYFNTSTHLVFIGSLASVLPLPRAEAYGASKAAVAYLSQSLAVDLATRGIKVTLVNPGFVKTPLTDKNDFSMPMLVSPQIASNHIRRGISAGKAEISFPTLFSVILNSIAFLPLRLQLAVVKHLTKRSS